MVTPLDSGVSDASLVDAMASAPDAMAMIDAGARIFDASLQPPADANLSDATLWAAAIPLPSGDAVFVGTGTGEMTVPKDASGLVP